MPLPISGDLRSAATYRGAIRRREICRSDGTRVAPHQRRIALIAMAFLGRRGEDMPCACIFRKGVVYRELTLGP